MSLSIKIGTAQFENPVTVASGTFGYSEKYYGCEEIKRLGAIVPKTVTLYAQEGNPSPRIVETPAGMLNAIGIENPGIDVFIEKKLSRLSAIGVPLVISVSGNNEDEFKLLAEKLNKVSSKSNVKAIELNLSCPNLRKKILVAQDEKATYNIVNVVKKISRFPVIAKLSPNVTDISLIAKAAEDGGADAVSMINTVAGMVINVKTRTPVLGNVTGGLSGPAIRPIAVNMVYRCAQRIKIPIIGMGGISNAEDALQFLMAGATMVAVGTTSFVNPQTSLEVLDGIKKYMRENKIKDVKEIVGSVKI